MSIIEQLILVATALVANFFSALAGGGTGIIQFPLLIFLGLSFKSALATHKVASVALGVGAMARHLKENHLERRFAAFILLTGMPGAILGSLVVLKIPDDTARLLLGIMTIGMGLYSLVRPGLGQAHAPRHREGWGRVIGGVILFLIGILNGSISSGTGLFVTLVLVSYFGEDMKRAVAYTLILVGLFWNGAGAMVLAWSGQVAWTWMPALLAGAVVGSYAGTHVGIRQGNRWIKRCFEVLTLAIGAKLLFA